MEKEKPGKLSPKNKERETITFRPSQEVLEIWKGWESGTRTAMAEMAILNYSKLLKQSEKLNVI